MIFKDKKFKKALIKKKEIFRLFGEKVEIKVSEEPDLLIWEEQKDFKVWNSSAYLVLIAFMILFIYGYMLIYHSIIDAKYTSLPPGINCEEEFYNKSDEVQERLAELEH